MSASVEAEDEDLGYGVFMPDMRLGLAGRAAGRGAVPFGAVIMGLISRIDHFLGKAVLRAFGTVFLVAGSIAGYHAVSQLTEAWEARNWPMVEGQVIESALRGGGPLVRYKYAVGDEILESTTVHIGQYKGIESHAREIVERYPAGKTTPVYHRPGDPQTAVLEHRFPWTSLLLLFMAAGFLGGAYVCFRSRRSLTQIVAEAASGH